LLIFTSIYEAQICAKLASVLLGKYAQKPDGHYDAVIANVTAAPVHHRQCIVAAQPIGLRA
jgi:hypothetical protein